METKAIIPKESLKETVDWLVTELREEFPNVETLFENETYDDEDVVLKIYASEDDLSSISNKAAELSLDIELKTGYFILPLLNPIEAYPIGSAKD